MVLFVNIQLPNDVSREERDVESADVFGDLSDHPTLNLEFIISRPLPDLIECLPPAFSNVKVQTDKYIPMYVNTKPTISLFPLDNPYVDDSSTGTTSLREAADNQKRFWKDRVFAPLDWFLFAKLLEEQSEGPALFVQRILNQYRHYSNVALLFADPVLLGQSQEDYYLMWEANESGEFKYNVVSGDRRYSLLDRETIVTACVNWNQVILAPEYERVIVRNDPPTILLEDSASDFSPEWLELVDQRRRTLARANG